MSRAGALTRGPKSMAARGPRRATGEPDPRGREVLAHAPRITPSVISPLVLVAVLLLMSAQLALGTKPIHDRFVVDETFAEDLCGIEVTTHVMVKVKVLVFEDRLVDVSTVRVTWTNAEGDWLQNFVAGPRICRGAA